VHVVNGSPPNIVLVVADDLGIGDLGAYGGNLIRTRTCDRLARTGVVCTSMYTPGSTDTPARAGLLTGRYGARFNLPASVRPDEPGGLPEDVATVASALRAAGYSTGLFGQWRLGSGPGRHPLDKGFDTFSGTLHGTDVTPLAWYEGRTEVEPAIDIRLGSRRITQAAEDFLSGARRERKSPFFIVVSHLTPHFPFEPDPRYAGGSDAGKYGDTVETIDRHLARLLAKVRRGRRGEKTLVIVTSDNGPKYQGATQGRRGRKPEVMDGGTRVPFIASWLQQPLGHVDSTPRSLLDVTPTLCALADAQPPPGLDGEDMSPLLSGRAAAERGAVFLFYNEWLNAMRSGKWKLHHRYGNDTRTYMPQLFDLEADPREAFNLAEKYPDVVDELLPHLLEVREEVRAEADRRAMGGAA
jgi:arylsulfatase A